MKAKVDIQCVLNLWFLALARPTNNKAPSSDLFNFKPFWLPFCHLPSEELLSEENTEL